MSTTDNRRYTISEVSAHTGVPVHTLRKWEKLFPMLRPRRNRANWRFYTQTQIDIVRRIKQLLWHEKLTPDGARVRLAQELHGVGRPQTRREAIEMLDQMEKEIRGLLELLDEEV